MAYPYESTCGHVRVCVCVCMCVFMHASVHVSVRACMHLCVGMQVCHAVRSLETAAHVHPQFDLKQTECNC